MPIAATIPRGVSKERVLASFTPPSAPCRPGRSGVLEHLQSERARSVPTISHRARIEVGQRLCRTPHIRLSTTPPVKLSLAHRILDLYDFRNQLSLQPLILGPIIVCALYSTPSTTDVDTPKDFVLREALSSVRLPITQRFKEFRGLSLRRPAFTRVLCFSLPARGSGGSGGYITSEV